MSADDGELARLTAADHALIGELITTLGERRTTQRMIQGAFVLLGAGSAAFAIRARNWWVLALSVVATGVVLWLSRSGRGVARIQEDAAQGHKRVRVARVDDRYADDDHNVLVLDGIATAVERRWFEACQRGDRVQLDTLPRSGVLLAIRPIEG